MVVIFALALVLMISMAGLLIDGGLAEVTRRDAQAAADTAAMAAAKAISLGTSGTDAAQTLAAQNGFAASTTDCSGNTITGVAVNSPPLTGPNAGVTGYVEVIAQKAMRTAFSGIVGQSCWMVSARAVASINSSAVSPCALCSLNATSQNHTLLLQDSATLRVDGTIYVNSSNGGTTDPCTLKQWNVCGDGFDTFGTGGYLTANHIDVVGGWETHDQNIATATTADTDPANTPGGTTCEDPNPPSQAQTANVCIHMPVIADPLNDPSNPVGIVQSPTAGARPVAGTNGCPATATSGSGTLATPTLLTLASGTPTICPGTYYGGIKITGGSVTMQAGVYNIAGGGFQILNAANLDGSAGVMIYNSSLADEGISTSPGIDLVPAAIPGKLTPKLMPGLATSLQNSNPGTAVTYTMTVAKAGPPAPPGSANPTGTVTFYDGQTPVCSAVTLVASGPNMAATCSQTYPLWGSHAISAVYSGDSVYNAIGATLTQTVKAPGGGASGPFTISTTGSVKLYGPTAGQYSGLTIFQDRLTNSTITIDPGTGSAASCPANFMTITLAAALASSNGCGALGGLQGTIYAPDDTALVLFTASGLAVCQVIAGEIEVDSAANTRFAYNASVFALGHAHLVE
jgi:Flp pilus assembly protein TadG